jgi:hypothetical protein
MFISATFDPLVDVLNYFRWAWPLGLNQWYIWIDTQSGFPSTKAVLSYRHLRPLDEYKQTFSSANLPGWFELCVARRVGQGDFGG